MAAEITPVQRSALKAEVIRGAKQTRTGSLKDRPSSISRQTGQIAERSQALFTNLKASSLARRTSSIADVAPEEKTTAASILATDDEEKTAVKARLRSQLKASASHLVQDMIWRMDEEEAGEEQLAAEQEEFLEMKWRLIRKCMLMITVTILLHFLAAEMLYQWVFASDTAPASCRPKYVVSPPAAMVRGAVVQQVAKANPVNQTCGYKKSWTDTSLMNRLDQEEFLSFSVFVYWFILVFSGLGTELLFGTYVMERMDPDTINQAWLFAQLFFPMVVSVALLQASRRDALGMVFMVFGLWKFGFPETFNHYSLVVKSKQKMSWGCASDLFNGMGTLCHHSSAVFVVAMLVTGYFSMTQPILQVCIPIIFQHVTGVIRYYSMPLSCVISLSLEIIWEWEVFSTIELLEDPELYGPMVPRVAIGMLVAHWFYMIAAFFATIDEFRNGAEEWEDEQEAVVTDKAWQDAALRESRTVHAVCPEEASTPVEAFGLDGDEGKNSSRRSSAEDENKRSLVLPKSTSAPVPSQPGSPTMPPKEAATRKLVRQQSVSVHDTAAPTLVFALGDE